MASFIVSNLSPQLLTHLLFPQANSLNTTEQCLGTKTKWNTSTGVSYEVCWLGRAGWCLEFEREGGEVLGAYVKACWGFGRMVVYVH